VVWGTAVADICCLAAAARFGADTLDERLRQAPSNLLLATADALMAQMRTSAEVAHIAFDYIANAASQM
jgi:hypothetical protein